MWLGRAPPGRAGPEARQAYDKAFAIWKDADPDLPLLLEARKEYAASLALGAMGATGAIGAMGAVR